MVEVLKLGKVCGNTMYKEESPLWVCGSEENRWRTLNVPNSMLCSSSGGWLVAWLWGCQYFLKFHLQKKDVTSEKSELKGFSHWTNLGIGAGLKIDGDSHWKILNPEPTPRQPRGLPSTRVELNREQGWDFPTRVETLALGWNGKCESRAAISGLSSPRVEHASRAAWENVGYKGHKDMTERARSVFTGCRELIQVPLKIEQNRLSLEPFRRQSKSLRPLKQKTINCMIFQTLFYFKLQ